MAVESGSAANGGSAPREVANPESAGFGGRIDLLFPWLIALFVLALDQITKQAALATLEAGRLVPVVGSYLSFTYVRNPGIAFGLHLGAFSRPFFVLTALVVLGALIAFYRATPRADRLRRLSIALLCAGAIGNLIDRVLWSEGVIDFIRLAVGGYEWPIFNVADMAVTGGAILLGVSLLTEGREPRPF